MQVVTGSCGAPIPNLGNNFPEGSHIAKMLKNEELECVLNFRSGL